MREVALCIVLVLGVALAGRFWVRLPRPLGRTAAWLALGGGVAGVAFLPWDPIARMVGLCCVLLAAMKALVYLEWAAHGRRLGWGAYAIFAFLWFGMDPGAFAARRLRLEWSSHLRSGVACMMAGTLGALLVRNAGWSGLLLLFVPLSIGFHYGALRVLTAGWRGFGFPVRVLFRNPLRSSGLADFWSTRWNVSYSQMMARVVMRPAERFLGAREAMIAAFLVSGLLHEVAISLPVRAAFGLPTLYFALQCLAVQAERFLPAAGLRKAWAAFWVLAPLGLLFPPAFRQEVIVPCLHILPDLGAGSSP